MAVPKRKTSKARRDKRKSANMKIQHRDFRFVLSVMNLSSLIEFALTATDYTEKM